MILENALKIHVFLESVDLAVAAAVAAAVASAQALAPASRFKDPALLFFPYHAFLEWLTLRRLSLV